MCVGITTAEEYYSSFNTTHHTPQLPGRQAFGSGNHSVAALYECRISARTASTADTDQRYNCLRHQPHSIESRRRVRRAAGIDVVRGSLAAAGNDHIRTN